MAWTIDRYAFNTRLQLGREEFVRPLSFGTNWRSIRIGVRCSLTDGQRATVTNIGSFGWIFGMGVQQGSTTSFWANSVTDWMGGGYVGSNATGANMNIYTVGTPGRYTCQTQPNGLSKIGSTYTFGTATSTNVVMAGAGVGGASGAQFSSAHFIDITKGATSYAILPYYLSAAQGLVNITDAVFLAALETTATPTNSTAANTSTVAYTGAGLFDTLSVIHSRFLPMLEIDMIGVSRWA